MRNVTDFGGVLVNGKSNKLINEKSPYLLQHTYNPVEWYPWGELLKKQDKKISLCS
jgi:uncharacterized protein YyaL (SSP411 family)